jgi:hypothetical protein
MTFALEVDVPMPVRSAPGGRRGSKYPFADMEVGHSFLVPGDVKAQTIRSATAAYIKRTGDTSLKFSVRAVADGVRVWRVE